LDFAPPYRLQDDTPQFNAFVVLLMIAGMIYYWPTNTYLQKELDKEYPTEALAYLQTHPVQGNVLNFYLWGGYLEWHQRDIKVFLDSRVDIFEYAGVLQDYFELLGVQKAKPVLNKYKIRYVLFPQSETLTYVLEHDSGWKVLYRDNLTVLLERADESAAAPVDVTKALPSPAVL
jgi:hypothetical protein